MPDQFKKEISRVIVFLVMLILLIAVQVRPLHAENISNDPCQKALSCYSSMIAGYGGKRENQLRKEKDVCDHLKQACERLKTAKNKPRSRLKQAYEAYQQAFNRYTALATTSSAANPAEVQKALEKYQNSYAEYKKLKKTLKRAQQDASSKPEEKNVTLDTSGVDGIVDIDPSDVENNIEYIEGLRQRSHATIETKNLKETPSAPSAIKQHLIVNKLKALGKTTIPKPYKVISKIISRKGGVIRDGTMSLRIPAGALSANKKIVIKKIRGALPRGKSNLHLHEAWQVGAPYDFGPDGVTFHKPVTISIKYQEQAIPEGMDESNLILVYFDGEKWSRIKAIHNRETNTFSAAVNGFPGSIIVTVGVPVLIAAGYYAITKGVHKKIYQLFWDPIKKNWVHQFIKPNNPLVKKYAKRIGVTSEFGKNNTVVPFDDPEKLAKYLKHKLTKQHPELVIGFTGKNRKQPFISLTDKYISDVDNVNPVEDYLKKIDSQEKKFGDCIDVTNALVSILRSKGYKIKGVSGYLNGGHHAWSEVVIGDEVYGIDEKGRISKLDYFKKYVTYPKAGDPYRKEWDEKGTRVYQPTLLIVPPVGPIFAQDGKKHIFTLKTVGFPKNTLFSWNFNHLGNSIKSRKKTFSYKFMATGNYPLTATAYWDGNKKSAAINIMVRGKKEPKTYGQCKNKRFHFTSPSEAFDFVLLTPRELFAETTRYIGHPPSSRQKKIIFKKYREDYINKKSQYKNILPDNCLDEINKQKLFVAWDGVYKEKGGKKRIYKKGYQIKSARPPFKKPNTNAPGGAGNPFGGYNPGFGMDKVK